MSMSASFESVYRLHRPSTSWSDIWYRRFTLTVMFQSCNLSSFCHIGSQVYNCAIRSTSLAGTSDMVYPLGQRVDLRSHGRAPSDSRAPVHGDATVPQRCLRYAHTCRTSQPRTGIPPSPRTGRVAGYLLFLIFGDCVCEGSSLAGVAFAEFDASFDFDWLAVFTLTERSYEPSCRTNSVAISI